ncbi:MAG: hypothetical protein H0U49_11845 [Parachlamydiaceae bacterium]|nr:hypothetical protein [Parachlamydiaceae bacterium]
MDSSGIHGGDNTAKNYLKASEAFQMVRSYSPFLWRNDPIKLALRVNNVGLIIFLISSRWPAVPFVTIEALKASSWFDMTRYTPESFKSMSFTISAISGIFASALTFVYLLERDRQILNWKSRTEWKLNAWGLDVILDQRQCKSICEDAPREFCDQLSQFQIREQS